MLVSRKLWLSALAVVASGLAAAPARAADVDGRVPADTEAVVFVNVRQILDSGLVKKHGLEEAKKALKGNDEASKAFAAMGLDPFKDIETVLVATPTGADAQQKMMVFVRGKFEPEKILASVEAEAKKKPGELKISKEGALTLLEMKNKDTPQPVFGAFLDKTTFVLSPGKAHVLDAAKKDGAKPAVLKKELQDVVAKMDNKQSLWMAAVINNEVKGLLKGQPQTMGIADKLSALTANVNIADGVEAFFRIHTTDAKAADEVKQLVDGIKNFAGLAVGQQPGGEVIGKFIDALKVTAEKETVVVGGKISEKEIEEGIKKIKDNK